MKDAAAGCALLACGVLYALGWRWPLESLEDWLNAGAKVKTDAEDAALNDSSPSRGNDAA